MSKSRRRAALGVGGLKVVLVDPEVGAKLLTRGHGKRLVVSPAVLAVRVAGEDRRPQDGLAWLGLGLGLTLQNPKP